MTITIRPGKEKKTSWFDKYSRVSTKDLAIFTRQLATLMDSGVSMNKTFDVLLQQTNHSKLREIIESLRKHVADHGMSLSQALAFHKDVFSSLYIAMVKCGESSGFLPKVMLRLADAYERDVKLLSQYKAALTYPAVAMLISIITIIVVLKYVIPAFIPIFSSFNLRLPWPTRMLLVLNKLVSQWWFLLFVIALIVFLVIWLGSYLKTPQGKKVRDNILMRIPVVNMLVSKVVLARFCRVFGMLYNNGYPLLASLELLKDILDNAVYEKEIERIIEVVTNGDSISQAMEKSHLFPRVVSGMITAGEEAGNLSKVLSSITYYYDVEVESFLENVNSLLEPLAIIFLGFVVGFILIATILPLYGMIGSFGSF